MKSVKSVMTAIGIVSGPLEPEVLVCQRAYTKKCSGLWVGDDPFAYSFPVLLFQLIIVFFTARLLHHLFKPFRQSLTVAQITAGILIGPSFLGRNQQYSDKVWPPGGMLILATLSRLGFMIHLFTLGIQVDASIIKTTGKTATLIGTSTFVLPLALGGFTVYALKDVGDLEATLTTSLIFIVVANSISSFVVITTHLTDLRILNSEIGRLASNASLVCEFWAWTIAMIGPAIQSSTWDALFTLLTSSGSVLVIFFIIRPAVIWSTKHLPKGGEMDDEVHFFGLMVLMLCCGLLTEVLGQHAGLGTFLLGLALPHGPPLGTSLVYKLEAISSGLLVPTFTALSGMRTSLTALRGSSSTFIELIILMGYVGKFCGALLSSLCSGLQFWDATTLSLILCCKGIVEVALYTHWIDRTILSDQMYSLSIITMLIVTAAARPMISFLYDPSRRYMAVFGRRTFENVKYLGTDDDEKHHQHHLGILVCIHTEDDVPTVLDLLQASNPTLGGPISAFILHLQELQGRAASILMPHPGHLYSTGSSNSSGISLPQHIVKAFKYYEQQHSGCVEVQHFTCIAPYASMHDDVCSLAVDKGVTAIIIPFHKQWDVNGTVARNNRRIRNLNTTVLDKAPCTVGILIDRSHVGTNGVKPLFSCSWSTPSSTSDYHVGVLFLGGADDRETLAYGLRMAENPKVRLSVVWIRKSSTGDMDEVEDKLDEEAMEEVQARANSPSPGAAANYYNNNSYYPCANARIRLREEDQVKDGVGTTKVIYSMAEGMNLLMVGRYHNPEWQLLAGLLEWNEYPELGTIGDLLVESDFNFSVLVVQQQPSLHHRMVGDGGPTCKSTSPFISNHQLDLPPPPHRYCEFSHYEKEKLERC